MIFWIIIEKETGNILNIFDYKILNISEDKLQIKAPHDFPIGCRKSEMYYDFDYKIFRKSKPEKLQKWFLNLFNEEEKEKVSKLIKECNTIDQMNEKIKTQEN